MGLETTEVYSFPVDIDVKTIGSNDTDANNEDSFRTCINDVIATVLSADRIHSQRERPSRNKRYLSITTTIHFLSRQELDNLRQVLTDHPRVLWLL